MMLDINTYDSLMSIINYLAHNEYRDFIEIYENETDIYLGNANQDEIDDAAAAWDNHIYCDVVKVYRWLRRETLSELN